jgi:hypothetical protein
VKNLSKNEAIFKGKDVLAFHTTQSHAGKNARSQLLAATMVSVLVFNL